MRQFQRHRRGGGDGGEQQRHRQQHVGVADHLVGGEDGLRAAAAAGQWPGRVGFRFICSLLWGCRRKKADAGSGRRQPAPLLSRGRRCLTAPPSRASRARCMTLWPPDPSNRLSTEVEAAAADDDAAGVEAVRPGARCARPRRPSPRVAATACPWRRAAPAPARWQARRGAPVPPLPASLESHGLHMHQMQGTGVHRPGLLHGMGDSAQGVVRAIHRDQPGIRFGAVSGGTLSKTRPTRRPSSSRSVPASGKVERWLMRLLRRRQIGVSTGQDWPRPTRR